MTLAIFRRAALLAFAVLGLTVGWCAAQDSAGSSAGSSAGAAAGAAAEAGAGEGAVLWRSGDHAGAMEVWRAALNSGSAADPRERARLAYNLGVGEHHAGDTLRAAAWFESALRLAPRWDAARVNRDLARADSGLDPRNEGIVGSFVKRFTRGEAEWLALLGGILLALAGALEALRGGGWKRAPWLAIVALPVLWTPLIGQLAAGGDGLAMVVAGDGAALYGSPDTAAERLGKLKAGAETRVLDELPGWVKVMDRGEERWTPEDSVLSVIR